MLTIYWLTRYSLATSFYSSFSTNTLWAISILSLIYKAPRFFSFLLFAWWGRVQIVLMLSNIFFCLSRGASVPEFLYNFFNLFWTGAIGFSIRLCFIYGCFKKDVSTFRYVYPNVFQSFSTESEVLKFDVLVFPQESLRKELRSPFFRLLWYLMWRKVWGQLKISCNRVELQLS